ncbi:MAG: antitoxin [Micrococcales bacterium]
MTSFQTRVFQNGGSQAIRIPADLRFEDCAEVSVWRDPITQNIVISLARSRNPLAQLAAEIGTLPEGSELMTKAEADALVKSIKSDPLLVD